VDPMATLLNANGDVVSMLITHFGRENGFGKCSIICFVIFQTKAAVLLRNVFMAVA
jgi:hypothetical protein